MFPLLVSFFRLRIYNIIGFMVRLAHKKKREKGGGEEKGEEPSGVCANIISRERGERRRL